MGERAVRFAPRRAPTSSTCARSARRSRSSTAGSRRARPRAPRRPTSARRRRRSPRRSLGLSRAAAPRTRSRLRADPPPPLRRELAIVEAADLFNASTYRRTVGGIAKSLGEPQASIVTLSGVTGEMARHGRLGHLVVPVPRHRRTRRSRSGWRARARARRARGALQGVERARRGRRPPRARHRAALATARPHLHTNQHAMIYCVIPRELEDELFDKMVEYYKDNPNVTVIVDRREGPDRRAGQDDGESEAASARSATAAAPRMPGTFPDIGRPAPHGRPTTRARGGHGREDLQELHRRRVGRRRVGRDVRERRARRRASRSASSRSRAPRTSTARSPRRRRRSRTGGSCPAPKRGEILFRFARAPRASEKDELTDLMTHEMGKVQGRGRRRRPGSDRHEPTTWPARAGACWARRRRRSCATSST